jgi:hypothetical protein
MGLDLAAVQLLCCARSIGVDFSDTLMIGRQSIHSDIDLLLPALSAIGISSEHLRGMRKRDFGEPLFRLLGAQQVSSLDASNYERATYICDLNKPCPSNLMQKFSVVHDGGSLEHVFNLPQALKNCMQMVRVGGHFIQITAANNFMGHGFWQLSPEAIYRTFSEANGYSIKAVLLYEVGRHGAWYQVTDPAIYKDRVELVNRRRTYVCAIAQRVTAKELFAAYPQQSDYIENWKLVGSALDSQAKTRSILRTIRQAIPSPIKEAIRAGLIVITKLSSPFNHQCYRYISADDLVRGRIS